MANRTLKENKKYPSNWRLRKRGEKGKFVLFYRVPKAVRHLWGDKSEVKLGEGKTLVEAEEKAFAFWASKISTTSKPYTLGELFNRYRLQVLPTKKSSQRDSNTYSLNRLQKIIDLDQPVVEFKTHQAYEYRDFIHYKLSAKRANSDIETLSHIFTKAIEWGCERPHPIINIMKKIPIASRGRYVTDEELDFFLSVCNDFLKVYVPLKLATGKDQGMLLRLRLSEVTKEGVYFGKRIKTGAGKASFLPFEHDGEPTGLREIINDIMAWRAKTLKVQSMFLFASKHGKPMFNEKGKATNFRSQWSRAMDKAILETDLSERFTEHDLRAKTASDIDNEVEAARLLQHASVATTRKIYLRKPQTVVPFKRENLPQ